MTAKTKRILLILLISVIAIAAIGYLGINPLLNNVLKKQVEKRLIGNFAYEYDTIMVDVFKRSVTLKNVKWRFPKDSSHVKHKGTVKVFSVEGVSLFSFSGDLGIKSILVDEPTFSTQIQVNKFLNSKDDTSRLKQFNFYSLIDQKLNSLEVDKIKVSNADAQWYSPDFKKVWREVKDGHLLVEDFKIDSATAAQNNGLFGLSNFDLHFKKASLFLPDSLHSIELGYTDINYPKKSISIDSLRLKPLIRNEQLARQFYYEKTSIDLLLPKITFEELDFDQLFEEQSISISKLTLTEMELLAFKDKNAVEPTDYKPLPQKLLRQLSKSITLDSLIINNASIAYHQKDKSSDEIGKVNFEEINGSIANITNDSMRLSKNAKAVFKFSTLLFDKSNLSAEIEFQLDDDNSQHKITGSLAPIELKEANQIITPLQAFLIKDGQTKDLAFNFWLNNEEAQGDLKFLYNNLKVQKLDAKTLQKGKLDNKLISFVANSFVVRNSNPDWKGDEKKGEINFKRNKQKSIFHFWWQAILTGLQSILMS